MAAAQMYPWYSQNNHAEQRSHLQYAPGSQQSHPGIQIPPRNTKDLSRDFLASILNHFASLVPSHFNGQPIQLVVHGGACMLLHPGLADLAVRQHTLATTTPSTSPHNALPRRTATRDVDYIHRSFVTEWQGRGIMDASERLKSCIKLTAQHFQLGADWMNSDADVALPMATDVTGQQYDPIYTGALQPNNIDLHTVFISANRMLRLISVPPVWSIALKLVRYTKYDPGDICLLLRNGTNLNNVFWTVKQLDSWLKTDAWPMRFNIWTEAKKQEWDERVRHAVKMVNSWDEETALGPVIPDPIDDWNLPEPAPPPLYYSPPHPDHSHWHPNASPPAGYNYDSHHTTPEIDGQRRSNHTRSRSHRPSTSQSPWHACTIDPNPYNVPSGGVIPAPVTPGLEKSKRKSREKTRSKNRVNDRRSKWTISFNQPDILDSDTDSDDDDHQLLKPVIPDLRDSPRRSPAQQPFVPRPSAFAIYGPPRATPFNGSPSHQRRPSSSAAFTYPPNPHQSISHMYAPDQRSSSTVPFIPDQRRSTSTVPYNAGHRRSVTATHLIPDLSQDMSNGYHSEERRSRAAAPYHPDQQRRALTPSPHPYHGDRPRSSTPYRPEERSSTPYYSDRRRPPTPYHDTSRAVSPSPSPQELRHRPPPLDLSPTGTTLLVF